MSATQAPRIDEQLNLIIPTYRRDGKTVYVHASPISREVYDQYWYELALTFSMLHNEGFSATMGPRVSARMLKRVSIQNGTWQGDQGVEIGLMAEIRRLANVVVPGDRGWQTMPLDDAIRTKAIDEDDADQVENALVFFSVGWRLYLKLERVGILDGAVKLWGASTKSVALSAFIASLPISTVTGSTGETPQAASSPPSSTGQADPASRTASGQGPIASPGETP